MIGKALPRKALPCRLHSGETSFPSTFDGDQNTWRTDLSERSGRCTAYNGAPWCISVQSRTHASVGLLFHGAVGACLVIPVGGLPLFIADEQPLRVRHPARDHASVPPPVPMRFRQHFCTLGTVLHRLALTSPAKAARGGIACRDEPDDFPPSSSPLESQSIQSLP